MFADDLALIAESEAGLQEKYRKWQEGMLKKGLKINRKKTEVLVSSKEKTSGSIRDNESNTVLKQVGELKYLGIMLSEEGGSETAVRARVKTAWSKWRELAGVMIKECQEN